jgi:hypothetical protein
MIENSGSFLGHTRTLHMLSLADVPGHELQTVEVTVHTARRTRNGTTPA